MSVIAWIVLGLIAGLGASKIVNRKREGAVLDIILGVVGALLGGYLFQKSEMAGAAQLNLYGSLVSVAGAVVGLFICHAFVRSNG